jgi:putative ABC transport system substrate-binding protein
LVGCDGPGTGETHAVQSYKATQLIAFLGGTAAWPLAARAQQPAVPVAAFLSALSQGQTSHLVAAWKRGLSETGFVDGKNVAIEYRFADGQ